MFRLSSQIRNAIEILGIPKQAWRLLHYTAMFEAEGEAVILPQCLFYNEQQGFLWKWEPMPTPRPLFNLDAIYRSNPYRQVLLAKDERAADAAGQIFPELPCICWSGGWNDAATVDFQPLVGESVQIWPDNTELGAEMALFLARRLENKTEGVGIVWLASAFPDGWTLGDPLPDDLEPWDLLVDDMSPSRFKEFAKLKFPKI